MSEKDKSTEKTGVSKNDVDTSDEALYSTPDQTVRKISFPLLSKSSVQSVAKAKNSDVFKNCLRLLSNLLPDERDEISDCLLDFFLKNRIYNENVFSLINPNKIPKESTH